MDDLHVIARNTIERFDMLPEGCVVIVGFSGGADSTALMHFLWMWSRERNISVAAAHVNHCLRGEESERDEQFVREWCRRRGIPLSVKRIDLKAKAQADGCGLEECGRAVRYSFFQELAQGKTARVATAHTLSDSVETVLLHLTQGSGTRGLTGIPPVRDNIIRPLIEVSREQVECYCKANGLEYLTDSSNFSRDYTRNRIRWEVIPALKEINPSLEQTLLRTMQVAGEDEEYLTRQAVDAILQAEDPDGYRVEQLRGLPRPVLSRAVRRLAKLAGASRLEARHIGQLCELIRKDNGGVSLPGGVELRISQGIMFRCFGMPAEAWESRLLPPRVLHTAGRTLTILHMNKKEYDQRRKFNKKLFNNALDYATITDSTVLRSRQPGDRFSQAGRGVTKTLKKLFNEADIPTEGRGKLILAAAGSKVLWLEGFGPAQENAVTDDTESVVLILPEECRGIDQ